MKRIVMMLTLVAAIGYSAHGATSFQWWLGSMLTDVNGDPVDADNALVLTYVSPTAGNANRLFPIGTAVNPLLTAYGTNILFGVQTNLVDGQYVTPTMSDSTDDYVGWYAYAVVLDLSWNDFTTLYDSNIANIPAG